MAEWYSIVFTAHICLSIYQLKGIWAVFTFCLLWIVLWWTCMYLYTSLGIFPGSLEVKASACNVGDLGLIPGTGRSPGEGNGNPFQYSCLENPMDEGTWWATVHGVTESQTQWSDFTINYSVIYWRVVLQNQLVILFKFLWSRQTIST